MDPLATPVSHCQCLPHTLQYLDLAYPPEICVSWTRTRRVLRLLTNVIQSNSVTMVLSGRTDFIQAIHHGFPTPHVDIDVHCRPSGKVYWATTCDPPMHSHIELREMVKIF